MQILLFLFAVATLVGCEENSTTSNAVFTSPANIDSLLGNINPPPGYHRIKQPVGSFGEWLRTIRLKKDRHVYLYNGRLKSNQDAQFAVLDIPVGNKDLQQCADAVMRLRAEYFFNKGMDDSICFHDGDGTAIAFAKWLKGVRWRENGNHLVAYQGNSTISTRVKEFQNYLETVFTYCGTFSLSNELRKISEPGKMKPGDVFIKGGFPGHAMIIVDVAENDRGEKVFMLAQSYTPAQDIHIVRNPAESNFTPWYKLSEQTVIETPEWTFEITNLKTWN
jgi:hypothetical protein